MLDKVKVEEIYTAYVMNPTGPSEIMPFNSKILTYIFYKALNVIKACYHM